MSTRGTESPDGEIRFSFNIHYRVGRLQLIEFVARNYNKKEFDGRNKILLAYREMLEQQPKRNVTFNAEYVRQACKIIKKYFPELGDENV